MTDTSADRLVVAIQKGGVGKTTTTIIEKHSDFLEAVVWEGLESDWEERLE